MIKNTETEAGKVNEERTENADQPAIVPEENTSSSLSVMNVFLIANLTCVMYAIMQAMIKDL